MAKIMTQLEFLTKNIMGAPTKVVKTVASNAYEDDEEAKKLDEEIWYLVNYLGGSLPAYQRQGGIIVGWTVNMIGIGDIERMILTAMCPP